MRCFGAQRVGWVPFGVFSSLALLMLLRSWQPWNFGLSHAVAMDLLNFLIPVLLLIGMVHIDTLMRERLRVEKEEQRLRGELETQVKERTAALDTANEGLQQEISLRKQGEQELLKS